MIRYIILFMMGFYLFFKIIRRIFKWFRKK